MVDAFKTCGSSPPRRDTVSASAPPQNYTIRTVSFRLVREPEAPRRPRLSDPATVATFARQLLPDDSREHFGILMLNTQNGLVAYHEVSVGTLNASLVHPREVFGPVFRVMGVAAIILIHNHPSGDVTPSREDLRLTQQLVEAGRLLDITVHDHVIIGHGPDHDGVTDKWVSLAQTGRIG
jgi:DNA repair protein RadC